MEDQGTPRLFHLIALCENHAVIMIAAKGMGIRAPAMETPGMARTAGARVHEVAQNFSLGYLHAAGRRRQ